MSGGAAEYVPQAGLMTFSPIRAIHQHLVGLHLYSDDHSRAVSAHHFCSCAPQHPAGKVRQCVIYDSDKADARLIGIEYVIEEDVFLTLDAEEKKFWHSHKYEVESGQLCLKSKALVPTMVEDVAEQDAMKELHKTYGKTIHTWSIDSTPQLPLGPPRLMHAFTADGQIDNETLKTFTEAQGQDIEHKRKVRQGYLDYSYKKAEGADDWEKTGKAIQLKPVEVEYVKAEAGGAKWKGVEKLEDVVNGKAA
ncbi:hypothetical protein JCM10212_004135 [Sporobolomyces blumeae]